MKLPLPCSPSAPQRLRNTRAPWALSLAFLLVCGCNTVEFYEMEAFSDPVMTLGATPTQTHFHQKVLYSMEGSAGGIGTGAGGGCGCY